MFKNAETWVLFAEWEIAVDPFVGDHHHFTRFNFAYEFRTNDVQGACFRTKGIAIANLADHKGAHTQWIAHTDQFCTGHRNHRKGTFYTAQGVFHAFGDVALKRACHQMDNAFTVRGALEN